MKSKCDSRVTKSPNPVKHFPADVVTEAKQHEWESCGRICGTDPVAYEDGRDRPQRQFMRGGRRTEYGLG